MVGAYERALNRSDVEGIVDLFADDAVLMDLDRPTAVGREQLRADYERGLALGTVRREFHVDQVLRSGDVATVRTHSVGGLVTPGVDTIRSIEARELFVLRREGARWRIAQYVVQRMTPTD